MYNNRYTFFSHDTQLGGLRLRIANKSMQCLYDILHGRYRATVFVAVQDDMFPLQHYIISESSATDGRDLF